MYVDAKASQRASGAGDRDRDQSRHRVRSNAYERENWLKESIPHFLVVNVGSRSDSDTDAVGSETWDSSPAPSVSRSWFPV